MDVVDDMIIVGQHVSIKFVWETSKLPSGNAKAITISALRMEAWELPFIGLNIDRVFAKLVS